MLSAKPITAFEFMPAFKVTGPFAITSTSEELIVGPTNAKLGLEGNPIVAEVPNVDPPVNVTSFA